TFKDGREQTFNIRLNNETLQLEEDIKKPYPEWTNLDFHKCPHCPFDSKTTPHCPIALNLTNIIEFFKKIQATRLCRDLVSLPKKHRNKIPIIVLFLSVFALYKSNKTSEKIRTIYQKESQADFENGRILGNSYLSIYEDKNLLYSKEAKSLRNQQREVLDKLDSLSKKVEELGSNKEKEVRKKESDDSKKTDERKFLTEQIMKLLYKMVS
ncbi:hypothetical protein IID62_01580, partial [candidate division KSB1 bacterium]|nr:hypothetical protein [candidate division KSB1 bacterium]